METNVLYYGDNLEILRHRNDSGDHDYFPDNSVHLIYLDPPFNSKQSYNVLFKENDTSWSPAQVKAFEDTWHWSTDTEKVYRDLLINAPSKIAKLLSALIEISPPRGSMDREVRFRSMTFAYLSSAWEDSRGHGVNKQGGSVYRPRDDQ